MGYLGSGPLLMGDLPLERLNMKQVFSFYAETPKEGGLSVVGGMITARADNGRTLAEVTVNLDRETAAALIQRLQEWLDRSNK